MMPGSIDFSDPAPSRRAALRWGLFAALVAALGLVIYHPVRHFEFLNYDDDMFISNNPWLRDGLTWKSVRWAFLAHLTEFSPQAEFWSPLTLLSRLLDAQFYGISAGPFHVTNALLHLLNTLLLCAALFQLTGKWGRSAIVALLFLVHPLNVEPVCWLSARKDLLGVTFFFCTLIAYARFARQPTVWRYLLVLAAFAACLMSKAMGMTVPFLLLLLDWWPLRRWEGTDASARLRLLGEKVPLLLLAAGSAFLALLSQKDWGALDRAESIAFPLRVENALVSYALYVRRVFWPNDLAIYYPHPRSSLQLGPVLIAGAFLVAATAVAFALRRRAPFVLAGWLWFGLVLGPVIGLVQAGGQAMADRYAYPSVIGLFITIVWSAAAAIRSVPRARWFLTAPALLLLTMASMHLVQFWRDSETVFTRALAVTRNNHTAHLNLAAAYFAKGNFAGARENYLECVRLAPNRAATWLNLGTAEDELDHEEAALADYLRALKLTPREGKAYLGAARICIKQGNYPAAEGYLQQASVLEPEWTEPYVELALMYGEEKRWAEAARQWTAYLRLHPEDRQASQLLQKAIDEASKGTPAGAPPK